MKKRTCLRAAAAVLTAAFAVGMAVLPVPAETEGKELNIVFTHDTHSHLESFTTIINEKKQEVGGFARIKTLIDEQKEKDPDTLVVDAGDFSMGTLVQTVYEEKAAELRMLGELGCEVTTLGNHEFDYRSAGLANMLETAATSGDTVPRLALCNVDWETMEAQGLNEGQQQIREAFETYGVQDYFMLQKGDVSIAVIGVFGEDALSCAPTCQLLFRDPVEAVKDTVAAIRENENADMIICVSHSGTWEDESKSEDEILAKAVPELDLIISGHTHTELWAPIVHGNTYIVSAGEYGKNLGTLKLVQNDAGRWSLAEYELIPVTDAIAEDEQVAEAVAEFMSSVDEVYLAQFGYTSDQVLAENAVEFDTQNDLGGVHTEHNLGSIIADAYAYAVTNSPDFDGQTVDMTVVPSGTVRDTYTLGDITVEEVFNSFSLGTGPDGVPGYPLVSVYLSGRELKLMAEIDASVSDFMTVARLYTSGLCFSFNPNRMILNKVTDAWLVNAAGERVEIQNDRLYRVVADLYSAQMLGAVTDMSYGLLALEPKWADGTPIDNLEDAIVMENGRELKAWDAIARYMASFADTDGNGTPDVPAAYGDSQDRKIVEDSHKLSDLLKSPNRYAAMIVAVVAIVIFIVVLLVVLVVKLLKHIRKRRKQ
ncbi:MAG: bifunctional metallophosphatase/5'-nucleotidase [Roseburia sp.]